MNRKIFLIISLLCSYSSLNNAANNEQKSYSLRVSKRESPLEQLFPSLRVNQLQNGSFLLHEVNSAINYANSTIQRVIDETRKLLNLTGDRYNSDDVAVIMAFPNSNSSLYSNESSKVLNSPSNAPSNANSSYGLNEVKDGLNFSSRFLDLHELLTRIQSPFNNLLNHNLFGHNLLGHKFEIPTTPATHYEPTYKHVYEESYPSVPVAPMVHVEAINAYEVPEAPRVEYEVPAAPHVEYKTPEVLHVEYKAPEAPRVEYVASEAPRVAYEEPKTPYVAYEEPKAPQVAYEGPKTPQMAYEEPKAPQVAYEEPKAPQYMSVPAKPEVEPQAVPYY